MNEKIKEALLSVMPTVYYGIGKFQGRTDWDCIVYGRRRTGKTVSKGGLAVRYFVAIIKEDEVTEELEEKVLQAMKSIGFKKSDSDTVFDYVEKSGETVVEVETMEFTKIVKECRA